MIRRIKQALFSIKEKLNPKVAYPAIALSIYVVAAVVVVMFATTVGPRLQSQAAITYNPSVTGLAYPQDFTETQIKEDMVNKGALMLVNGNYECHIDGINLTNLYDTYDHESYTMANYDIQVNKVVEPSLTKLLKDFYAIEGETDVVVSCGYRSKDVQQEIYNNSVQLNGEEYAKKYVQLPGFSEHQTGYAFDLAIIKDGVTEEYNGEGNFKWINDNCARYGLIVRYNQDKTNITGISNEPWHFRYVGVPHAMYITENNLTLEEYIEKIKGRTVECPLIINDAQMNSYMVYYYKSTGETTNVPVPKDKPFEISGNNKDGFIVTVYM